MSKNKIVMLGVAVVVIIGAAFYIGLKYGQSGNQNSVGFNNFSQRMASSTNRGGRGFGGAVFGQILSVDSNSLTVSSQTGGSRIIFLSASTTVDKLNPGSISDLLVGVNVSVNGSTNADNSINAQMIQIRPAAQLR